MIDPFTKWRVYSLPLVTMAAASAFFLIQWMNGGRERIDFNAQIRPIINRNCIACHGGVKRSGGFSLLFADEALRPNESGKAAIVPGDPEKSELIRRIRHTDPELRMPAEKDPLSEKEIELLTQWIQEGAEWQDHWAYVKAKPVAIPDCDSDWCKNEIDHLILRRLEEHELQPSPEAEKATLLRRLTLDLTGLPPTPQEVNRFLSDTSADAYEKNVERLLASPRYGERWASVWMDLARYGDSKGYEADGPRSIWQYRDWLIRSFNNDKPYDEFIIEQIAGDLLPNPTDDQLIATAFHRNSMNNDEGGTDDEEFRVAAVIDRVNTTWNALQGTTMECAQCHSHPTEPIRHTDYYRSYAFFNNTADEDVPGEYPNLKTFLKEQDRDDLEQIKTWISTHAEPPAQKHQMVIDFINLIKVTEPKIKGHSFDQIRRGTLDGFKNLAVENGGSARLKNVPMHGADNILISYRSDSNTGRVEVRADSPKGELLGIWKVQKHNGGRTFKTVSVPIRPVTGKRDLYFVFQDAAQPGYVCVIEWVLLHRRLPGKSTPGYDEIEKKFARLLNTRDVTQTPVMVELTGDYRRKTHVFERGNWLVHGEEVEPGVPESWNVMLTGSPPDRLDLAHWITSDENPLTARVMVNRLWAQLFGSGIVETLEDFGSQGFTPSHPALLDWLALEFQDTKNWSMKSILRTIVQSATYRQSSKVTARLLSIDPANRLLARGPRVRLSAEQIRDQALAVAGLLTEKMFGPSVMPPQPEGVWQVARSNMEWRESEGEGRYRRALYTFWRRTSPYPSMMAFDSPSREFCVMRRINTNTPIQALVLLNDPVYVEAALALARRSIQAKPLDIREAIAFAYFLATARASADGEKLKELEQLYEKALEHFNNASGAAESMIGKTDNQLAALTVVVNAIMNLDEFITKS